MRTYDSIEKILWPIVGLIEYKSINIFCVTNYKIIGNTGFLKINPITDHLYQRNNKISVQCNTTTKPKHFFKFNSYVAVLKTHYC